MLTWRGIARDGRGGGSLVSILSTPRPLSKPCGACASLLVATSPTWQPEVSSLWPPPQIVPFTGSIVLVERSPSRPRPPLGSIPGRHTPPSPKSCRISSLQASTPSKVCTPRENALSSLHIALLPRPAPPCKPRRPRSPLWG